MNYVVFHYHADFVRGDGWADKVVDGILEIPTTSPDGYNLTAKKDFYAEVKKAIYAAHGDPYNRDKLQDRELIITSLTRIDFRTE